MDEAVSDLNFVAKAIEEVEIKTETLRGIIEDLDSVEIASEKSITKMIDEVNDAVFLSEKIELLGQEIEELSGMVSGCKDLDERVVSLEDDLEDAKEKFLGALKAANKCPFCLSIIAGDKIDEIRSVL
jgi:hypothetical protein